MALTPQQQEQKAEASRAKAATRRRQAARERLRQWGTARSGNERKRVQIAAGIEAELPDALAAGITYDEMADLTGLSRARVAQILQEWRKKNPLEDDDEKPAKKAAKPKGQAAPVVAAVGDL